MYTKGIEVPHLYVDLQYIFFEIYACTEVCKLQPKDAFQRLQIVEAYVCNMAWEKMHVHGCPSRCESSRGRTASARFMSLAPRSPSLRVRQWLRFKSYCIGSRGTMQLIAKALLSVDSLFFPQRGNWQFLCTFFTHPFAPLFSDLHPNVGCRCSFFPPPCRYLAAFLLSQLSVIVLSIINTLGICLRLHPRTAGHSKDSGSSRFNPLSRRSGWKCSILPRAEGRDYLETHQMMLNSIQAVVLDLSKAFS